MHRKCRIGTGNSSWVQMNLKKKIKPNKLDDLQLQFLILECLEEERYFQSLHFIQRMEEREVSFSDVIYILKNGYHEKQKPFFHDSSNLWRYAIRGRTVGKGELRVIITFDENNMIIITVIDLLKKDQS